MQTENDSHLVNYLCELWRKRAEERPASRAGRAYPAAQSTVIK